MVAFFSWIFFFFDFFTLAEISLGSLVFLQEYLGWVKSERIRGKGGEYCGRGIFFRSVLRMGQEAF